MSTDTETLEIVVAAQDRASRPIKQVEGELLQLSKNSRMLKRETRGLSAFANALDTIAGTSFGNLIGDIQTVRPGRGPLKDIGLRIKDKLVGAGVARCQRADAGRGRSRGRGVSARRRQSLTRLLPRAERPSLGSPAA